MPRGNWIEILMLVLFVGSSAIAAIYKKLKEQAEKKRAQDSIARREFERLRTGRDPGAGTPPQPAESVEARRAAEVAQRRRAQIEELRRRAAARAGQSPRPAPLPIPGGVVIQIPGSGPVVIAGPVPRPAPQTRPVPPRREKKRKQTASDAPVTRPVAARPLSRLVVGESDTQRRVEESDMPAPEPASRASELVPSGPGDWRRAIIFREVLGRPLALRED